MTGKRRYRKSIQSFAGRKEDKVITFSGTLGITTNGENQVEVPGRPGYVWVQLRNQLNETIQAFNESVSPVFSLPVLVEWDKDAPIRYKVRGRDIGRYTVWVTTNAAGDTVSNTSSYLPAHSAQHSFNKYSGWGGGDVLWVYSDQFMPWAVTPSGSAGSLSVSVQPSAYYYNDQFRWAGGTGIAGLDVLRPTGTSSARMILVYLDPDTGNPYLATGSLTEFANTITGTQQIMPYMPSLIEETDIPLAGIRLITGTNKILWQNLYDLRDYFAHASVSGTTGNGGAPDDAQYVTMALNGTLSDERVLTAGSDVTLTDGGAGGNATVGVATGTFSRAGHGHLYPYSVAIYDDHVFKATGTILDFTGNIDVAATGSSVFISSTAAGGGGSTVLIYDDGAFKVTGSAISFDDNLTVHVTGSTAYVVGQAGGAGGFPIIYDDGVFKATGVAIDFGANLDVSVTGTTSYISSTLPDWYDVTYYGATGDGSTDDTSAVQSAIDAAEANSGGIVYFPPGSYAVTGLSIGADYVELQGDGASSIIKMTSATGDTVDIDNAATRDFIAIRKLRFAPSVTRSSGAEIDADNFAIITLEDLWFTGGGGKINSCIDLGRTGGDSVVAFVTNIRADTFSRFIYVVRVIDLWVAKCSTDANAAGSNSVVIDGGVESSGWVECDFVNSANNDASGTGYCLTIRASDYSTTPPRFNNFQQCFFDSHQYGLHATAGKDISFIGCWFSARPQEGALVNNANCENFVFDSCRFENCGTHGLFLNAGSNHQVIDCSSISNNQQSGGADGFVVDNVSGLLLTGNSSYNRGSFGGTQRYGLNIGASMTNFIVKNNDFRNNDSAPISNNAGTSTTQIVIDNLPETLTSQDKTIQIFDDSIFKATGTAISFDDNLTVSVTGSVIFVDGQAGSSGGGYPIISEDSVFKATGVAIDFGENMNVAVTGTTVFVSSVDTTGGGGGDLLIYDNDVFQVTGTALDFGDYLNVAVTGSIAYISSPFSPTGFDIGARVYRSTNQTIPNSTGIAISFDSERYDTDGIHSGSSTQLYCNTAGKYSIHGQIYWDNNATGYRQLAISLNGTTQIAIKRDEGQVGSNPMIHQISTTWDLNVGDYVELVVNQTSGGNLNVLTASSFSPEFMMHKIDGGGNAIQVYDDSVFVATGTAISFDAGLDVVSTGTTAYVSGLDESVIDNYSGTSTVVGWSSLSAKDIFYWTVGDTVFVSFVLNGTSNSTSVTFTLPYTSAANTGYSTYFSVRGADNGVQLTTSCLGELPNNSNTVTCYKNMASATWTASNSKYVMGHFSYKKA